MNAEVHKLMATGSVAKTIDRKSKTLVVVLRFGGSSSCGTIPVGGTPAGPLSRDDISSDI